MSFKVAIACEDPTYDRYIIEPVVAKACEVIGRPRAQIRTITSPATGGVDRLKAVVCEILSKWGGIADAMVFVVDADGEDGLNGRRDRRLRFTNAIARCRSATCAVVVVARQEIEVWALWGCYQDIDAPWDEIRREPHPKERFFEKALTGHDSRAADRGRRRLIEASLQKGWASLETACEELAGLRHELSQCL